MQPFESLQAIAAPIDERNLDTNQLCPTHFNKVPRTDPDYQRILFNNQRFNADGSVIADFILNRAPYGSARILVADDNFGCGSSRETAVYALWAFGIRCVIAPSFGDIFHGNALKNGLLPVRLPSPVCAELRAMLHAEPGAEIGVDLNAQTVTAAPDRQYEFDIQARPKRALLLGQDEIASTAEFSDAIAAFERRYQPGLPWLFAQSN